MPLSENRNKMRVAGRFNTVDFLAWPTFGFIYFFLLLRIGGVDHLVAGYFVSPDQPGFPLRHDYLTEHLLHDVAQGVMKLTLLAVFLVWLSTWFLKKVRALRYPFGYLLLTALVSVSAVNLGKRLTDVDCPWDLQAFGGQHAGHDLFASAVPGAPVGHCFPGGHSFSGFALFGLFFLLRRYRPDVAYAGLFLPLLLGTTFAVNQWVRGAHFPSHDLTTAYLCWMIAVVGDTWLQRRLDR